MEELKSVLKMVREAILYLDLRNMKYKIVNKDIDS